MVSRKNGTFGNVHLFWSIIHNPSKEFNVSKGILFFLPGQIYNVFDNSKR